MREVISSSYIRQMTLQQLETFASSYAQTRGCWEWYANRTSNGYGQIGFRINGKIVTVLAHRVMYETMYGYSPYGHIDHLCRNHRCVNPQHLELVTAKENTRRGFGPAGINAKKTHCIRGHEFSGTNLHITKRNARSCKKCSAITSKTHRERQLA